MPTRIGFDWRDLELFIAAADSGSIARAAERCHIVPSAASKRLSDLEAAFGTALLERHNRGVRPTAAGLALLVRSRGLLEEAGRVEREIASYGAGLSGHVRLFANISSIVEFLPPVLASFDRQWPGIRVDLEEHVSARIAQAVTEGVADLGVVSELLRHDGLELTLCRSDELVLLAPPGQPLTRQTRLRFAAALDYPMVGLKAGSTLHGRLLLAAGDIGRDLPLRIQVGSFDAVCAMVSAGLGVGVVPRAAISPYLVPLGLAALTLDEPWATHHLYLCRKAGASLSPAAERLFGHLAASGESA